MTRWRWEDRVEALARDTRLDGEGYLYEAVGLLSEEVARSVPQALEAYRTWLVRRGRRLIALGRERAALFRVVDGLMWAVDQTVSAADMRNRALLYLENVRERRAATQLALVEEGAEALALYSAIMVAGRDGASRSALTLLGERALAPRVYLGEGRPSLAGLTMATELAWAGVNVTLGSDMALFGWLSRVEALLLCAESISAKGVIAARGAAALAEAAYARELPVIVLAARGDLMAAEYAAGIEAAAGDPDQILSHPHERISVRNELWDTTPVEHVTRVITEDGILAGDALLQALRSVRAHPALAGR
ncbi:MAG: hypothetical protein ACOX2L_05310 [Anaerolineae bacterium]|jgi:translation initiation factor 2B subunit (eIF-2B alpha/beta/delta family)|nr:hypothetical protein [Chloroflexota bacterium]